MFVLEIAGSNSAVMWIAGILLAIITAGESALRNFSRNRLERLVRDDARRERILAILENDRHLIDSLLILRLIATIALTLAIADAATGESLTQHAGALVKSVLIVILVLVVVVYGVVRQAVRGAPERTLLVLLGPMRLIDRILFPLRWLLGHLGS